MISIIIEIDDIEISMTADQAIRLRDELNRLFAPIPSQPQPITPLTMIGPGLWERPDPPPKHTKFDALVDRWEQDEQRRPELKRARRWVDESFRVDHADLLRENLETGIGAIFGQRPGDETEALERLS